MTPPPPFDMRTARAYAVAWSWALRRAARTRRGPGTLNPTTGLPHTTNACDDEQNARARYLTLRRLARSPYP